MQQKLVNNTKGNIAALQTILERYPILVSTNADMTKTSLTFMLDILKMIGISEQDILEWLSKMLAGNRDVDDGILAVLEHAIKLAVLTSFKDMYTCSVNPILPDDVMYSFYEETSIGGIIGNGIEINVEAIDPFGMLHYCPLDAYESVFYFDVSENIPGEPYSAHTIYRSADFNAYLWYIINRSNFNVNSERPKCIWDNRDNYYRQFKKNPNVKNNFFKKHLPSATQQVKGLKNLFITGLGVKKELFGCSYEEKYDSEKVNNGYIKLFINADRYYKTTPLFTNKTIFEFNADYLSSIKLFDPKTLTAQIVNSVLGIGNSYAIDFSVEKRVMANKVREIVKKVMESNDTETTTNDCYYTFTNAEYEKMLTAAELQKNGQYQSGNENGDLITVDTAFTIEQLQRIEGAENLEECETAIKNALTNIADNLASTPETPEENEYSFKISIINKFIEEMCVELTLQAISPKIMILYAINEKIMSPQENEPLPDIFTFLEKFNNLLISIIKTIYNAIIDRLFDFLIGQIKPIIVLFIEKLLLETIMYYRMVLTQLFEACKLNRNRNAAELDNVSGADIIPVLKSPEEGCRTS